jgi:cellulose synthase/poly-beta-1,6-N-acetylglucosamine synthase-like glycosyltransferase
VISLLFISVFLLGYSYVFYPIIIKLLASNKKQSFIQTIYPKVAIVMSVYQEEFVIRKKIHSLKLQNYPEGLITIWIGSDGSTDNTNAILAEECEGLPQMHTFYFGNRRGKPKVMNELVEKANFFFGNEDFILILTDANVLFKEDLVLHLVKPFIVPEINLVDSLILPLNQMEKGISFSEKYYLMRESELKCNEGKWAGLSMGASGGCYAIRSKAFVPVPDNFLVDDFFISFNVLLQGGKAILYQEAICYEEVSSAVYTEFKRRRRISSGNFQNLSFFISKFSIKQFTLWLVFFSHKVIRWFGPMLLMVVLFCIFYLSLGDISSAIHWFYFTIFICSVFIFDLYLENKNILLPLLRGIRYFVVINAALFMGFIDFLKGIKNNVWEPTERNQSFSAEQR